MHSPFTKARFRPIWVLVSLYAGLITTASYAQQEDTGFRHDAAQQIEVVADSLEVANDQQTAIFQGNVNATQGRMGIRANTVKVKYRQADAGSDGDASPFSQIEASGNVVLTSPDENATGDWAVYEVDSKTITLGGAVVLTRGSNVIRGRRLVVNLVTGQSKVDGGETVAGQQRVRAVFTPKKKNGAE